MIDIGRLLLSIEEIGDDEVGEDLVVAVSGYLVVPDLVVVGVLGDLELFFLLTVMLSMSCSLPIHHHQIAARQIYK